MTIEKTEISFDDMMSVLADRQRRTLLMALLEHDPQDDSPVAIAEPDSESAAAERVVSLYHIGLPKLADYGFIDWDRENHNVGKGPDFDQIRPLLELLESHEDELPSDLGQTHELVHLHE